MTGLEAVVAAIQKIAAFLAELAPIKENEIKILS